MEFSSAFFYIKQISLNGDWNKANRMIQSFLHEHPTNPDAVFMDGYIRYRLGEMEEARSRWNYTLILSPGHPGALEGLMHLENPDEPIFPLRDSHWITPIKKKKKLFNPFQLFFSPKNFFSTYALDSHPLLIFFCTWIIGMMSLADRMEHFVLKINSRGIDVEDLFLLVRWDTYWLWCTVFGFLIGAFIYIVGGALYRLVVYLCGAPSPDIYLTRRIYIYSGMVSTIPFILYALWEIFYFATPHEAIQSEDPNALYFGLLLVICLYWSLYTNYRGVRSCFSVRKWRTRFMFFGLYGFLTTIFILVTLFSLTSSTEIPNIQKPASIDTEAFSLQYPSNWIVDKEDEGYEVFTVEPELEDAYIEFTLYSESIDIHEVADWQLEMMGIGKEYLGLHESRKWGRHPGFGYVMDFEEDGNRYKIEIFASTTENAGFSIVQVYEESIEREMLPAFVLIQDSFLLKDPPPVSPAESTSSLPAEGETP